MNKHQIDLTKKDFLIPARSAFHRSPKILLTVGIIGLVLSFLFVFLGKAEAFYFSYLVAFAYFLSIALGALLFVIIHFAANSTWSVVIRRVAENIMGTLPIFAILFIPLLFGLHDLYHWAHEGITKTDNILAWKEPYLNLPFFIVRAVIYLLVWGIMSHFFLKVSLDHDKSGDPVLLRKLQVASYPSLLLFGLSLTFASFDWLMSLDPHWYSTMFGVYYFSGAMVSIFALLSIIFIWLHYKGFVEHAVTTEHFQDLGKLLFAFSCFWAYIAFSQFMLIWYANLPEEAIWFAHRWQGTWKPFSIFLAAGHFGIPFFYLMPRTIKRKPWALLIGSTWMLVIHYLDIYWLVMPTYQRHGVDFGILDLLTLFGIGGVFLGIVAWRMSLHPLIPIRDPRLEESVAFINQ
ncbi:MAG TPA: hypothetical protein VJL87_02610 [Bdellovibrionota bacterium]|nr:hypothetical protein [Bdellovibrionota bacterium]